MNFLYSDIFMQTYFSTWVILLLLATAIVKKNKNDYEFLHKSYWKFLFEPWKLITFFIATTCITIIAPYSGDPTWDYPDSILISVLTYVISPWTAGIFYQAVSKKKFNIKLFTAIIFFLVPCWAYDAYIYFKDGYYPTTWFTNVIISSGIVLTAGLFWNLCWSKEKGTEFAFRLENWPQRSESSVRKMLIPMLILMFPVVYAIGWFVYNYFW
ncbi:MAG: hypothetical protein KKD38_01445 [Candidatus Delongbacteria bacterium]|nr:hypothetical protein [Candidatus Delongbacteria bacterium]MCG2760264.1 hypothetical protein [Candidatus Delongbacteria bacterium]